MPHTRAWNESTPAGTDLVSSIDDSMRNTKVDIRERLAVDHLWDDSIDHDGKHLKITLRPEDNVTPIESETTNFFGGGNAGGLINLIQTWNTSGLMEAIKIAITDTASALGSLLVNLIVDAASVFTISKTGNVFGAGSATFSNYLALGMGSATVVCDASTINVVAIGAYSVIRITAASGTSPFILGGFTGGTHGRILFLINRTGQEGVVSSENVSVTAADRIQGATAGAGSQIISEGLSMWVWDPTSSRWLGLAVV